jgi:hypothetical protein
VRVAYSSGNPHRCRLLAAFRPGNPIPANPRFLRFGSFSSKKHVLGGHISHVLNSSHTSVPPKFLGILALAGPTPPAKSRWRNECARPDAAKSRVNPNGKPGSQAELPKPSSSTFLSLPNRRDSGREGGGQAARKCGDL